jgi:hypothetical protein
MRGVSPRRGLSGSGQRQASANAYGHCPLFTHPAAAVALKVGDADAADPAIVVAGGAAVTVEPMLIAVGSTDIAGMVGDVYKSVVGESPDPPATLVCVGAPEGTRLTAIAATTALPPTKPANDLTRLRSIYPLLSTSH